MTMQQVQPGQRAGTRDISRTAIQPMSQVSSELMPIYWGWYLRPFTEPEVSDDCREFVLKGTTPELSDVESNIKAIATELRKLRKDAQRDEGVITRLEEEEKDLRARARDLPRLYRSELLRRPTFLVMPDQCISYLHAATAHDREHWLRKGWKLLHRIEGGSDDGSLQIWPPTRDECVKTSKEIARRHPWGLAQLDAKLDEVEENLAAQGVTPGEMRNLRERQRALKVRRRLVADGVPSGDELLAFFMRFERVRAEAQITRQMREQTVVQGRVDRFRRLEEDAIRAVRSGQAAPFEDSGGVVNVDLGGE